MRQHADWAQGRPRRAQGAGDRRASTRWPRTATCSRCCWSGRSASRGGWPAPTSTARSTACAGTSRRSTGSSAATARRTPLPGPVSNIASWNYPMSVQVHAELVQAAGRQRGRRQDPDPGRLPLPDARARAHGPRRAAGHPAVRRRRRSWPRRWSAAPALGALAFVGGRSNGRRGRRPRSPTRGKPALPRAGGPQRLGHLGLQPVGRCSPRTSARASSTPSSAAPPTRASSCSAGCSPAFLDDVPAGARATCASATRSPSRTPGDPLPELDFGPVISARKAGELRRPVRRGAAGRARPAAPRLARRRPVPRRAGHLRLRRPGRRARPARAAGRCTTPSRSGRSTRSSWSTPRPSCWPR